MATRCAASANWALSTILRSGFPHEPRSYSVRRFPRPRSLPQHARPFSSTTQHFQIQIDLSHGVTESSPQTESKPKDSHPSSREPDSASAMEPAQKSRDSSKKKKDRKNSDKEKKAGNMEKLLKKKKQKPEPWQIQKDALEKKFPAGWNPPKKLSPDALDGIRHLHATAPERFTTTVLAEEFKVSPEAIRRILKSRWRPSEGEMEKRRQRWERRHERIWSQMHELGLRPPTKRSRPLQDSNRLFKEDQE